MLPELPLLNVTLAEFPVLLGLINALQKTLALLFLRKVKIKLDDPGAVPIEMLLKVHNGAISFLPNDFFIEQFLRNPLCAENLRMHTNDENLFVIRTIENADSPTFRQSASRAPQKIVLQFLSTRLFKTEDLAALRIDAGHHVSDRAVLPGGVHRLKNKQQRIAIAGIEQTLQSTQFRDVFG